MRYIYLNYIMWQNPLKQSRCVVEQSVMLSMAITRCHRNFLCTHTWSAITRKICPAHFVMLCSVKQDAELADRLHCLADSGCCSWCRQIAHQVQPGTAAATELNSSNTPAVSNESSTSMQQAHLQMSIDAFHIATMVLQAMSSSQF